MARKIRKYPDDSPVVLPRFAVNHLIAALRLAHGELLDVPERGTRATVALTVAADALSYLQTGRYLDLSGSAASHAPGPGSR